MKRKYISPETALITKVTCTLCAGSTRKPIWNVDQTHDETSPDMGDIIGDKGEGKYTPDEYDPWNSDNW